jgi:sortase A
VTPIGDPANKSAVNGSMLSPVAFAAGSPNNVVTENAETSNANAWYPTAPQKHSVSSVNTYYLSIPKLKIQNALVTISGDDLDKSLVHYGGTGLPGQYGTAVIFGHSELPQFFSPTNYKSIFSLLPTLKIGDKILINFDGVDYTYRVYDMIVLQPTDLTALEQNFDDSYLTLVTCVPPGTLWARLNVRAKLDTTL